MTEELKHLIQELGLNFDKIKAKRDEIKKNKIHHLSFTIVGEPLQTARPRTTKFGSFYVPNASKNKKFIRKQIAEQLDINNFRIVDGEVHVKMKFYVSIPKNFPKIDKALAEMKYIRPTILPDIDNYLKTYLDAMTSVIWLDDGQVTKATTYKYYSINPRVEIEVSYYENIFSSILRRYAKEKQERHELGKK